MIARALALATLLATPHVTEFGGTFGSDLGGIALAHDGSLWVSEHDRVAHVQRDGRVREFRIPIDVYQGRPSPAGPIAVGPGGDLWFGAQRALGRISPGGRIRLYGAAAPYQRRYLAAFDVSRNDAWYAYGYGVFGVFHVDASGVVTRADTDLNQISALAAAPDGAVWIAASERGDPNVVTLYRRPPGGPRQHALDVTRPTMLSFYGTTSTGALVAGRFEWTPRSAHLERIEPDGSVSTILEFAPQTYATRISVAFARDGSTWLTEPFRNRVVRVAPDGSRHEFRRGLPDTAGPTGIVADDAGGAWFTDVADGLIGHVDANGTITTIGHGPITESTPALPVVASDGAVWYREAFDWRRRLARLAPDGTLREFPSDDSGPLVARGRGVLMSTRQGIVAVAPDGALRTVAPNAAPSAAPNASRVIVYAGVPSASAAAAAPDGAAWFAGAGAFARIDRSGAVRTIPARGLTPDSIAFDAKGTLWFTDTYHSLIGSVAPNGRVRTHTRGLTRWNSGPQWIARGPDGAMWFTEVRDRIGRITRDGRITEFAHGIPHRSSLGGIVTGPDGALWFTLWHGNVLGRMTTAGRITLHRGLVTPSRGNEHDPDAVLVPDGHGGFWFNESQGGRIAHLTFRTAAP